MPDDSVAPTTSRPGAPTFSVVVPVRNAADTIARCLDSVIAQTSEEWELVVIDGASTDGTQAILAQYDDSISYWESEPDSGICDAWNKALGHARGAWMLFLGADDRLATTSVLAKVLEVLPDPELAGIAYGTVSLVGPGGTVLATVDRPWEEIGETFFRHNTIPHQAVFHHRSVFARNGRFDETFKICGDYEFLMRELRYRPPRYLPDVLVAEVAMTGLSMRPESSFLATREQRRAQLRHGVVSAPAWRSFRLLRAAGFETIRRIIGLRSATRAADLYRRVTRSRS